MGWGNAKVLKVLKGADGKVTAIEGELFLAGDVKAKTRKLTWLADTPDLVEARLIELDFLLNKDKVEEDDDVERLLTPTTRFEYVCASRPAGFEKGRQPGQHRPGGARMWPQYPCCSF